MKAPRLAFAGELPCFWPGINMTIRYGPKWANEFDNADLQPFDVAILDGDGAIRGTGRIFGVYFVPIAELKPEWSIYNYDPAYRTHAGVLAGLKQTYGAAEKHRVDPETITPASYVSVVFFSVD